MPFHRARDAIDADLCREARPEAQLSAPKAALASDAWGVQITRKAFWLEEPELKTRQAPSKGEHREMESAFARQERAYCESHKKKGPMP